MIETHSKMGSPLPKESPCSACTLLAGVHMESSVQDKNQ